MTILDGKALSEKLAADIRDSVPGMVAKAGRPPHLCAVLVGDNAASKAYVGNKIRLCGKVGFRSTLVELPADVTEQELLDLVDTLNADDELDGYIVQLPLPDHIDEQKVLLRIDPLKDVDGFHPTNFGKMALGLEAYKPATPYGIQLLLEAYDIPTSGREVVVIGRSNIVGTPISILLSRKGPGGDATVTLTHSRTTGLADHVRRADIIIAAIGIAGFVKGEWIREGAVVIDVGMNRVDDAAAPRGYRLVGDVDFEGASGRAAAITPVPGGVGPMTVMALIQNTLQAYTRRHTAVLS